MLVKAIPIARAGYQLMKRRSSRDFFVVAIYLRANLTAERYIVAQTDPSGKVCFFSLLTTVFVLMLKLGVYHQKELCSHGATGRGFFLPGDVQP
jgi:hypothetical protein